MRPTATTAASTASGGSGATASRNSGFHYQRRDVERTTLYPLVRDHLETFYQAVEEGFASAPLPNFVKQEFERFLDCGVLCRGAALLVCETCSQTNVIALSCKGRGFCPSCLGRRMAQTSANIIEDVVTQCTSRSSSACYSPQVAIALYQVFEGRRDVDIWRAHRGPKRKSEIDEADAGSQPDPPAARRNGVVGGSGPVSEIVSNRVRVACATCLDCAADGCSAHTTGINLSCCAASSLSDVQQ